MPIGTKANFDLTRLRRSVGKARSAQTNQHTAWFDRASMKTSNRKNPTWSLYWYAIYLNSFASLQFAACSLKLGAFWQEIDGGWWDNVGASSDTMSLAEAEALVTVSAPPSDKPFEVGT